MAAIKENMYGKVSDFFETYFNSLKRKLVAKSGHEKFILDGTFSKDKNTKPGVLSVSYR